MNDIQQKLEMIWEGKIEKSNFDFLNNIISFELSIVENKEKTNHEIIFKKVTSFTYFKNRDGSRLIRHEPEDGDYSELSEIEYYEEGVCDSKLESNEKEWVRAYFSTPNFILDIWSSMLLIEAGSVVIDGETFDLI